MRIVEVLCQTTAFYHCAHFRRDLGRLLNVSPEQVALRIDSLFPENSILRSEPSASLEVISHDGAAILAAFGSGEVEANSISYAARQLLSMQFQFEFGPEADFDGKGALELIDKPANAAFGVQLAETIEEIWRGPVRAPVALTIGWHPRGDRFGLLKYGHPTPKRTLLYCSRDLFAPVRGHPVRVAQIRLNLVGRISLPCSKFRLFVELLKGSLSKS
jgi:hypothetical protein